MMLNFVTISILVLFSSQIGNCGESWSEKVERERAEAREGALAAGKRLLETQDNERIAIRVKDKKKRERLKKIEDLREALRKSANNKINYLVKKKESIQRYQSLTLDTLSKNKVFADQAHRLNSDFRSLKATEGRISRIVSMDLSQLPGINKSTDLIQPMIKLCEASKAETTACFHLISNAGETSAEMRSTHQAYLENITQISSVQEEFQLPRLELNEQILEQLESIKRYSSAREQDLSSRIRNSLTWVSEEITRLQKSAAVAEVERLKRQHEQWKVEMTFLETVNRLLKKKVTIAKDPENRFISGQREKLTEYFNLFLEVLSYKDACINSDCLPRSSPLLAGCILMKPLMKDAESFFKNIAKSRIALTLSHAKSEVSDEFSTQLNELQEAYSGFDFTVPEIDPAELLFLIMLHDQLLSKWNEAYLVGGQ